MKIDAFALSIFSLCAVAERALHFSKFILLDDVSGFVLVVLVQLAIVNYLEIFNASSLDQPLKPLL